MSPSTRHRLAAVVLASVGAAGLALTARAPAAAPLSRAPARALLTDGSPAAAPTFVAAASPATAAPGAGAARDHATTDLDEARLRAARRVAATFAVRHAHDLRADLRSLVTDRLWQQLAAAPASTTTATAGAARDVRVVAATPHAGGADRVVVVVAMMRTTAGGQRISDTAAITLVPDGSPRGWAVDELAW